MSATVLKMMSPAEMRATAARDVADLTEAQAAKLRLASEFILQTAATVLQAPPGARPELYRLARVEGAVTGLEVGFLPEQYGPAAESMLQGMSRVAGHVEHVTRRRVRVH